MVEIIQSFVKKFVKQGFVEAVIALPQNLYLNTGIACSLLVLSRNNKKYKNDRCNRNGIGRTETEHS